MFFYFFGENFESMCTFILYCTENVSLKYCKVGVWYCCMLWQKQGETKKIRFDRFVQVVCVYGKNYWK